MSFVANHRWSAIGRYVSFNLALVFGATVAVQNVAQMMLALSDGQASAVPAEPSRVERFKQAQFEAAQAPQVPVPRTIVAYSVPDMPVQVLAVRIDQAEGVKVKALKAKKKPVRVAKATVRTRKIATPPAGMLPDSVIFTASAEVGEQAPARSKKRPAIAESSRDIINRSLGVMVALKN